MNTELIKTISKRASDYALTKSPTQDNSKYFEHYENKFAELLISECADLCMNFKFSDEGPSEGAAYQRALCSTTIKEYFGLISKGPLSGKVIR
jgi:hypothetical protein